MAIAKTNALILRVTDYGETSQVLTALSPEIGLISAIAKGARRPKNAFQGPFDRLALCRLVYYEKRGDVLAVVKEAEVVEAFVDARRSLDRWRAAACVAELSLIAARPNNPDIELFGAGVRALTALCEEVDVRLVLIDFFARYLVAIGHAPDTTLCAATGAPLDKLPRVEWVIVEGRAYRPGAGPAEKPRVVMDATTLAVMTRFLRGVRKPLQQVSLPDSILRPLGRVLMQLIASAIDRMPVTFARLPF